MQSGDAWTGGQMVARRIVQTQKTYRALEKGAMIWRKVEERKLHLVYALSHGTP